MNYKAIHGLLSLIVFIVIFGSVVPAQAQTYRLNELTSSDFQALDRQRTAVIIPVGVLEEHGSHTPIGTDSYIAEWLGERVSESINQRPGWKTLLVPTLPIGVGAPEDFAPRARTLGSLPLRAKTKRAVLMDLVGGLGEVGFRWIFVVDIHGPRVNRWMTNQAARFFEDVYGGTMLNLADVVHPSPPAQFLALDQEARREDGQGIHAGLRETSQMLAVRPDLVTGPLEDLVPQTALVWEDFQALAEAESWPGYFGSPRRAGADIGTVLMTRWATNLSDLAGRILDGMDHRQLGRYSDTEDPIFVGLDDNVAEISDRIEQRQQQWMEANGVR